MSAIIENLCIQSKDQQLVLRECIMKHKCSTIFNPQYTHLKKGKRILRITVFGFPAWYKNK